MAKTERSVNPATAHLKSQKARAVKKSRAQIQIQRQEKLARRNPERLQKQIDELKAIQEAQGGQLRPKDKQTLEQLERDVKAVRKARESLGDRVGNGDNDARATVASSSVLGKRRRQGGNYQLSKDAEDTEHTDEEVRNIPMPRDTPPPIPSRKPSRRESTETARKASAQISEPVSRSVYSSAPQIRDLQKESTRKFLPSAVAARLKQSKGETGRYLEPEEVERLEKSGYIAASNVVKTTKDAASVGMGSDAAADRMEEQEAAFERELQAAEALEVGNAYLTRQEVAELKKSSLEDARKATEEAALETQYLVMGAEGVESEIGSREDQERVARRHLRHVEMEEVEDEDG